MGKNTSNYGVRYVAFIVDFSLGVEPGEADASLPHSTHHNQISGLQRVNLSSRVTVLSRHICRQCRRILLLRPGLVQQVLHPRTWRPFQASSIRSRLCAARTASISHVALSHRSVNMRKNPKRQQSGATQLSTSSTRQG